MKNMIIGSFALVRLNRRLGSNLDIEAEPPTLADVFAARARNLNQFMGCDVRSLAVDLFHGTRISVPRRIKGIWFEVEVAEKDGWKEVVWMGRDRDGWRMSQPGENDAESALLRICEKTIERFYFFLNGSGGMISTTGVVWAVGSVICLSALLYFGGGASGGEGGQFAKAWVEGIADAEGGNVASFKEKRGVHGEDTKESSRVVAEASK